MLVQQVSWTASRGWQEENSDTVSGPPSLVLYFAAPDLMADGQRFTELAQRHPGTPLVGCTTGGEILGDEVLDESIIASALWLQRDSRIALASHDITTGEDSHGIGAALAAKLPRDGLKAVLVLSDGTQINGSRLVDGLREALGEDLVITGGLAGDGLAAEQGLDESSSFLRYAREISHSHQEKFDSSGCPKGLVGEDIPLSGRLMAVADVYDALISRRVYKPPFPHETAVEIISNGAGKHFDPTIVAAFLRTAETFRDIAEHFSDDHDGAEQALLRG